jgi:hypothetical protein
MLQLYLLIWSVNKSKKKRRYSFLLITCFLFSSHIWGTLLDDVDFNYYRDDILELLDEFDSRYSPVTSTISFDNLIALIMHRTTNGKHENITKEFENVIPSIKTMKFTRLEFIALIPVIIYIESCLDHGKSLFRFRENSILDLHMQRALLS